MDILREEPDAPVLSDRTSKQVKDEIHTYLGKQPLHSYDVEPHTAPDESEQLDLLVKYMAARGHDGFIGDFDCPIAGGTAVRALVPGATCHRFASTSEGGRAIAEREFDFPILT